MPPRARLAALAALVLAALAVAVALGVGERLAGLRDGIEELGPLGPLAFIALYVVAVVAAVPASLLTVAAGALFGAVLGTLVVVVAATAGACIAFLLSRRFAREGAAAWLGGRPGAARVEGLAAEHGAASVALTRLVPVIPFSILNYAFGLTRVPFRTYAAWTAVCIAGASPRRARPCRFGAWAPSTSSRSSGRVREGSRPPCRRPSCTRAWP